MRAKDFISENKRGHAWGGDPKDLGYSAQRRKRYVDPNDYSEARRKPFQKWVQQNKLNRTRRNVLFDLKGNPQDTVVYHPPGKRDEIWAYEKPSGSVTSSSPMRMVKKDIAPSDLLY